ncbi:ribbon-helix-helix domain-containing protein [Aureimonas sp. AU40]|uniref:ribbon-helix-helix domain-containing protein n=1 Tax=Aureimonas sp. AU40 TaxID=1637747 RepID=UPI001FCD1E50|nr:type II toxin-antitoxin system ParD family antitoxin [Aureimonas sp. AU40]
MLTVSFTPEQDAFVRARMASGRFASAREAMRATLRLLQREENREQRRMAARTADASSVRTSRA